MTHIVLLATVLWSVEMGLVARAHAGGRDIAAEADWLFRRGGQHYKAGRHQDALLDFLASNRLVANKNAVHNIALCYLRLGEHSEAFRFLSEYQRAALSAEERAVVHKQLEQLRPRVALVSVTSQPPGARIFVDREDLGVRGTTPAELALPPGRHEVILKLPGHHPERRAVEATVGRSVAVPVTLRLVLGIVQVQSTPPGAEVRVDRDYGPAAGLSPARLELPPGRHVIYLSGPGYRPARADVEVRPGATAALRARLERLPPTPGKLLVTASVRGAEVRVDGQLAGTAPLTVALSPGRHEVVVQAEDYQPFARAITIAAGEQHAIDAQLVVESEAEVKAATKMAQSAEEAPASVTVVHGDEIRAMGYRTLGEVLRGLRGFYLSDDRQYPIAGVRGFVSPSGGLNNRLLFLADGHTLNDMWTGGALVGHGFAPDLGDVERIEVVRGPVSALYGTGAFFGVVDVTSRTAEPSRFAASLSAGSLDELSGRATVFQRLGGLGAARLGGAFLWSPRGATFDDPTSDRVIEDNDGERATALSGNLRLGDFTLLGRFNERKKWLPTTSFQILPGTGRAFTRDVRSFVELRWERALSAAARVMARAYYDHSQYSGRWPASDQAADDFKDASTADWAGGEVRVVLRPAEWVNLIAGAEGQYVPRVFQFAISEGSPVLALDNRLATGSGYALAELQLPWTLRLVAALRADYSTAYGLALSPDAALIIRPYRAGISKLFFGRGFRGPSVYELYYHDDGLTWVPSSDLGPETIYTWQLEHTHAFGAGVFAKAGVYFNDVRGLITFGDAGPNSLPCARPEGCVQYQNLGHVATLGAEAELRRSWGPRGSFSVAYAYQRTRDLEQGPMFGAGSTRIMNSPEHLVYLRLARPLWRKIAVLGSELIFGSPRRRRDGEDTSSMVLANVTLSGELAASGLGYSMSAYNVFGWRHGVPVGSEYDPAQQEVAQLGRAFLASLSARF